MLFKRACALAPKIIPRVTTGSWMVKQAVGQNTPVLLGRKITTKYFRCARGGAG